MIQNLFLGSNAFVHDMLPLSSQVSPYPEYVVASNFIFTIV